MRTGRRWEFRPGTSLQLEPEPRFEFVSLRLETFMKYGGPLTEFYKSLRDSKKSILFFSDYLPCAGNHWDPVHQLSFHEFAQKEKPQLISVRNPLSEVPPPSQVARDLLAQLPTGVETAVLVRDRNDLARVRDLNGVFVVVRAEDWITDSGELTHFADRILEVEVSSSLNPKFTDTLLGAVQSARIGGRELFVTYTDTEPNGIEDEFRALYPKLINAVGEARALQWLKDYSEVFSRNDWERFEALRAFPLFLRNQFRTSRIEKQWWVELALWEWTEFITLYSPADESAEQRSLSENEFMLNPTIQILQMEHDFVDWQPAEEPSAEKTMAFLFRSKIKGCYELRRLTGDWSTAAIVDIVAENARISEAELIEELKTQQGAEHLGDWLAKINALASQGLLLKG